MRIHGNTTQGSDDGIRVILVTSCPHCAKRIGAGSLYQTRENCSDKFKHILDKIENATDSRVLAIDFVDDRTYFEGRYDDTSKAYADAGRVVEVWCPKCKDDVEHRRLQGRNQPNWRLHPIAELDTLPSTIEEHTAAAHAAAIAKTNDAVAPRRNFRNGKLVVGLVLGLFLGLPLGFGIRISADPPAVEPAAVEPPRDKPAPRQLPRWQRMHRHQGAVPDHSSGTTEESLSAAGSGPSAPRPVRPGSDPKVDVASRRRPIAPGGLPPSQR